MRTSLIYVAGIALGIAVGLWTASMELTCPAFCMFGPPRFAAIECVLMGALIAISVLVAALAVNRDFPAASAQSFRMITRCYRTVTRFLFEDLTRRPEH